MKPKSLVSRHRIGVITRKFAGNANYREKAIKQLIELHKRCANVAVDGQPVFRRFDIMIPEDRRYSLCDDGKTASALRDVFDEEHDPFTQIHRITEGDMFCAALNAGVVHQLSKGCDYSLVISAEVYQYVTEETIIALLEALCSGARVAGVAITEFADSILEGRLGNTFCLWDNKALMRVGGFDLGAAHVTVDQQDHFPHMKGWDKEQGFLYYPLHGVEEVIPLARMVDLFGPCIAPIRPQGDDDVVWELPEDPELVNRHYAKLAAKEARQRAHLMRIGRDLHYLSAGVMPGF